MYKRFDAFAYTLNASANRLTLSFLRIASIACEGTHAKKHMKPHGERFTPPGYILQVVTDSRECSFPVVTSHNKERKETMSNFYVVCKKVYKAFRRLGCAGIGGAGETKDVWIFGYAPKKPNEIYYGVNPIIVNKKSGKSRSMNFFNEEDTKIYYSARKIEVPKKFVASYMRGEDNNDKD